jgi:exopolyphosphatase / guanosine-5'-triphosphate,3'-diphosphate pyrophosphatase
MRILAIDIGTNSVRYLACDVSPAGGIVVIERGGEITRLGEGVDASGALKPQAIERTGSAIRQIIAKREGLDIRNMILAATSAARDAKNSNEFLKIIKDMTGFSPKILTGEEEAEAVYKGVIHELQGADADSIIADIGGGSTELIYPKGRDEIVFQSIDVGAVRMTERFIRNDPPLKNELDDIRVYVAAQFDRSFRKKDMVRLKCIGLGGTITTLAAIHLKMRKYEHERVHGFEMPRSAVLQILRSLSSMTLSDRNKVVGLQPARADIIIAGTIILDALLDFAAKDSIRVSDRGILFGLALIAAGK